MTKSILILSSILFLHSAQADVFSAPENITHLTLQMAGSESQIDLRQSPALAELRAPNCNLTEVVIDTVALGDIDLSNNNISIIPDLSEAKNIRTVNFDHCFMTEANVDQILADLVETDSTTIEADLRGNAPPSSAGHANIAIIESRGGTVLID